jgi:hypothetical protein
LSSIIFARPGWGLLLKGVIPKEFYHFVELLNALARERCSVDFATEFAIGIEEDGILGLGENFEIGFDKLSVSHSVYLSFFCNHIISRSVPFVNTFSKKISAARAKIEGIAPSTFLEVAENIGIILHQLLQDLNAEFLKLSEGFCVPNFGREGRGAAICIPSAVDLFPQIPILIFHIYYLTFCDYYITDFLFCQVLF